VSVSTIMSTKKNERAISFEGMLHIEVIPSPIPGQYGMFSGPPRLKCSGIEPSYCTVGNLGDPEFRKLPRCSTCFPEL
jgi:hypothetical protein